MEYKSELVKANFKKRYKRFFADVEVDGKTVTAHVPNTGSMKTCIEENTPCFVTHNPDPKRKLKWTLERTQIQGHKIGVNTRHPNAMVFEAWQKQVVPHWKKFDQAQAEVKINDKSRLDLVLWSSQDNPELKKPNRPFADQKLHFIEIKNVTMAEGTTALFPDAVTSRGAKHIEDLVELMDQGHTCEMVYVIHREGVTSFKIAKEIDPNYNQTLLQAQKKGLKVTALGTKFKTQSVEITGVFK